MKCTCATALFGVLLVGCSSSKDTTTVTLDAALSSSGPLLPLAVGNTWTYRVTDPDGTISSEVVSVTAYEPVGGTGVYSAELAYRVVTGKKANDPNGDVSWQAEQGGRVVRYREISVGAKKGNTKNESSWDPPRLRLDESPIHIRDGATWNESFMEYYTDIDSNGDGGTYVPDGGNTADAVNETWTVVAVSLPVIVGAGTFNALEVRRTTGGGNLKTFWFAPGVGLIRQSQEGKPTHELQSYRVIGP